MALFGSLATVRAQLATSENFKTAFAYVEACLRPGSPERALLDGLAAEQMQRVELAGGVFALPQACMSQPAGVPSVPKWESHKAYIDVQAVIVGDEVMEVSDVSKLNVSEDLRPAKDVLFYHPSSTFSALRVSAGEVAVFYPIDGHRPLVAAGAPMLVRKVVVKVPVAA
jgi:YhcH/YjgK/YiaL family protein